jgi:hypothetical protein
MLPITSLVAGNNFAHGAGIEIQKSKLMSENGRQDEISSSSGPDEMGLF